LTEQISIFLALHQHLTSYKEPLWRAPPLVQLSQIFYKRGFTWVSRYYAMLALCDESRNTGGKLTVEQTSYSLMLGMHNMTEAEILRYSESAFEIQQSLPENLRNFPEAVITKLDQNWKTGVPSVSEYGIYYSNGVLIRHVLDEISRVSTRLAAIRKSKKDGTYVEENGDEGLHTTLQGDLLEFLGRYVMACMPGTRINTTKIRQSGTNTDYDIVCSLDGFQVDFRTELGRYFIGECKAWADPVNFDVIAKFSRVLDSVRSKFGIIFSMSGLTGEGKLENAESEQLAIYRDRGMVIVSVNENDLLEISNGTNFINMIREKYDDIRLLKKADKNKPD
jgi:hypothetical protein